MSRPLPPRAPSHGRADVAPASAYTARPGAWGRLGRYAAMRVQVRLSYRLDFAIQAAGDVVVAGMGLAFLWAIFRQVPDIKGYGPSEVLFTWGLAEAAGGTFLVLFQGLWTFNQHYLLRGELDRLLLRPVDPYLQLLLDNLNPEGLPLAALGVGMVVVAALGLPGMGLLHWALLPVFVVGGAALLGGVLTALASLGFLAHHRGTAIGLVYQGAVFNRYPLDLFGPWIRRFLTYVVPFGFVAYYPSLWYFGRAPLLGAALLQPLLGLVALALGHAVWTRLSRRYRSPGA